MIHPMLIIIYWGLCKVGMRQLVARQGSVAKYPDEYTIFILSVMSIVHCAIHQCIPGYVVTLVLQYWDSNGLLIL